MPHDPSRGRTTPRPPHSAPSRTGTARPGTARTGPAHAAPARAGRRPEQPLGPERPLGPDDPHHVGDYSLLGRLGDGTRDSVYLGRAQDGELVTVKLLPDGTEGPRARTGLAREADAALQVAGRNTARVLDADMTGDHPYIVSEYVEGPSLHDTVDDHGPLGGPQMRKVALRTAGALAAIHRAGIVHRAFNPGSVLLAPDGAKVVDFGAAGTTHAAPTGPPAYMAPEQIEDEPVGPPADVFAWGATMVFAATGHPPFGTGSATAVMRRVTSRRPDLGDMEGPLRDLTARCLDKNPAARPTARQLVRALREGHGPAPQPRPTRIPGYRWRMMLALVGVVALGFALGVLI
ncbi:MULTISPECIES: serine/threonine-protein kinase [Thermomonosporaceae]|uniref:serine/threonine-protein kinase n=1 Tax=Thermomonosporaceae TaxID=2012 RepID=UPI00255B30A4|nr:MULTISPECIES: serine/threonine-protein kinase [Thermomonosporaceae]MDL4771142.1 serine/threonine-protein kinase [Actinomadura xylanilytica]